MEQVPLSSGDYQFIINAILCKLAATSEKFVNDFPVIIIITLCDPDFHIPNGTSIQMQPVQDSLVCN